MKRTVALGLALCALALVWIVRAVPGTADLRSTDTLHAGLARSDSDARARLVELSLLGDRAPRRDGMLASGGADVPLPPLVHATWAMAADVLLAHDARAVELGGIDEVELEHFLQRTGPIAGVFAALLLAWAVRSLTGAASWAPVGVLALVLYACSPLAIARECAGSLYAHPFVVALLAVELFAFGAVVRAREPVDVAIGALGCGVAAALAQVAGAEAWPLSLAIFGALVVLAVQAPRTKKREQWRAIPLFLASGLALYALAEPGPAAERLLPEFAAGTAGLARCESESLAIVALLTAIGAVGAYRARRSTMGATLLAALFASSVCLVFDLRFAAPWAVCTIAACGLAVHGIASGTAFELTLRRATYVAAALALAACASHPLRGVEPSTALVSALRWLREHSSSPGPFNHPDAAHDWRVLTAPELAGSVVYHARRPVFAARVDGRLVGDVERLVAALRANRLEALAVEMANMDCAYVVVTARMLGDGDLRAPAGGALEQLVQAAGDDLEPHFRRVFVSARRETPHGLASDTGAPAVAIFRRTASPNRAPNGDGPSMSPVAPKDGVGGR